MAMILTSRFRFMRATAKPMPVNAVKKGNKFLAEEQEPRQDRQTLQPLFDDGGYNGCRPEFCRRFRAGKDVDADPKESVQNVGAAPGDHHAPHKCRPEQKLRLFFVA